jgi:hypothetical protein
VTTASMPSDYVVTIVGTPNAPLGGGTNGERHFVIDETFTTRVGRTSSKRI